jgi:hypothetical protein
VKSDRELCVWVLEIKVSVTITSKDEGRQREGRRKLNFPSSDPDQSRETKRLLSQTHES